MASEERFGYEWDNYSWMAENYEGQFLNWTHPLQKSDWKGKRFLDAGCGMGRNSYWPLKWGAASAIAFDNDKRSVASTKETLKEFTHAQVIHKSIYAIDWENEFDIAFSIGVIHHLEKPRDALARIVRALKPGGTLHIWVYSYEGNEWIVRYVDPVRIHITSRLPVALVHLLTYFCSVPLYICLKIGFLSAPYYKQIAAFDFWHIHGMAFDQLIPTVAHYWKKDEVYSLVQELSLENVSVEPTPEGTGWILSGVRR
ncbi:MAG: class I SAM-dependent methyltransferase [Minisyncoccia bacterium]